MIYAISDIHGDYNQATKLLKHNQVIDENNQWIAGTSTLVVAGDSTDRGRDGIKVLRLFYNLQKQAKEVGGNVIHLMGNHDALILSIALSLVKEEYNYEHVYVFKGNGGKMHEATSLSHLHDLRRFVQTFPGMCRVDDVLFQHVDGMLLYNEWCDEEITPDNRIKAVNRHVQEEAKTAWGAWNLFYHLTSERFWHNSGELLPEYLANFDADMVVHGHTGFIGTEPKVYLDNLAINIDAVMSRGYRDDEDRGCVLVIDRPGTDIVV